MRPNPISLETAKLLSEKLGIPIEHVMHMPPHILTQKLAELAKKVDDVVDQQKIEPAIEEAKEIVAEIVVNAEKKVSWLKKLFGKKNK